MSPLASYISTYVFTCMCIVYMSSRIKLVNPPLYVSVIHKIKHEVCGRDANKVQGKPECFISISIEHFEGFIIC